MLDNRQIEFLTEILRTNSPSGYEKQLMYVLKEHMDGVCSIKTDCIGNLYMYSSNKGPMTIMISAHADEVGFQITDIDNNGFVYARSIASPDKQTISGNIVTAITKNGEKVEFIDINSSESVALSWVDGNLAEVKVNGVKQQVADIALYKETADKLWYLVTLQGNIEGFWAVVDKNI